MRDRRSVVVLLTERGRVLERDFQEISQSLLEGQRKGSMMRAWKPPARCCFRCSKTLPPRLDAGSEERHGE